MAQKASDKYLQSVNQEERNHRAWSSCLWIQSLDVGPKPGTFLGFKGIVAIWKREHYQSPRWMASMIIIFISIKGLSCRAIVKFNFV